jgi:hypothetical protein
VGHHGHRVLSLVTAIDWTVRLGDRGFVAALITNAVANLREEIGSLVGGFVYGQETVYADTGTPAVYEYLS